MVTSHQDCARCGRRLITRRGDKNPTCCACRKLPATCTCTSLIDGSVFPPPTNPMGVARKLLTDQQRDGYQTLRFWRGGWMRWAGYRWAEDEPEAVRSLAYRELEHATCYGADGLEEWEPNQRKISDVADAMKAITLLPEATDSPSWLRPELDAPFPAAEAVTCSNGILHVRTGTLHPLTPRLFSQVAVPFPYDAEAPEPAEWLRFLKDLWPDDPDSIQALREFFGYVLSGRTDMHKILLFIGPPRSGRGTIARILSAMLGYANVAAPTLASLCTQFGLAPLIGKPLAIVGDARLGSSTDASQVIERLLSISGEDMLTIDRKHKTAWTGKLPTRFIIVSNELPRFADASGAIASRFIILTLGRSFLGEENHSLTEELLEELPGILRWSLDGLTALTHNDRFTVPASSDDAAAVLQDIASPVAAFIRDCCKLDGEIAVDPLWQEWKTWADDNGHRPGSKQVFGRDLRAAFPSIRMVRTRDDGDRTRRYIGVSLVQAHNVFDRGPSRTNAPTRENSEIPDRDTADHSEPVRDGPRSDPYAASTRKTEPAASLHKVRCPSCQWRFQTAVQPGETAWCKKCSAEFTVPESG